MNAFTFPESSNTKLNARKWGQTLAAGFKQGASEMAKRFPFREPVNQWKDAEQYREAQAWLIDRSISLQWNTMVDALELGQYGPADKPNSRMLVIPEGTFHYNGPSEDDLTTKLTFKWSFDSCTTLKRYTLTSRVRSAIFDYRLATLAGLNSLRTPSDPRFSDSAAEILQKKAGELFLDETGDFYRDLLKSFSTKDAVIQDLRAEFNSEVDRDEPTVSVSAHYTAWCSEDGNIWAKSSTDWKRTVTWRFSECEGLLRDSKGMSEGNAR